MTGAIRTLLPLLLVLLIAGCGVRQQGAAEDRSATVVVENQSWNQMRIYAEAGGQRVRLGIVSGNSTERLRIPGNLVGIGRDISFLADALAGGEARSFSIYVVPGDEVVITIPPSVR